MQRSLIFMVFVLLSGETTADSIRCGRKVVKSGDTGSELIRKCGKPDSKFSGKETVYAGGQRSNVSVSNWVYQRRGKNDMVVSIRNGTVVKIRFE